MASLPLVVSLSESNKPKKSASLSHQLTFQDHPTTVHFQQKNHSLGHNFSFKCSTKGFSKAQ